jgi:hypothetical protein
VTRGSRIFPLVVHNLSQRINSRGPSGSGVPWWHAWSGLPSCVALVFGLAAWKGRKLRLAVRGRENSRAPTALAEVVRARILSRLKKVMPNFQAGRRDDREALPGIRLRSIGVHTCVN